MSLGEKSNLIIYRIKEKGLEIFLVNSEANKEKWELPSSLEAKDYQSGVPQLDSNVKSVICLDPVENPEGGIFEQAYAVEGDWHDIPSIKSIIRNDVNYMHQTVKQMIPDMMNRGTFFAVKEAFRKVLPHQYGLLKELKDVLIDKNNTQF